MLFNYRYVPHAIEAFQTWLDHLVKVVWCRSAGDYSLDLLHPDLRAVVEEIANDESIKNDYLDGPIRTIDNLFRTELSEGQRQQVAVWYDNNNDIAALCENNPLKEPVTYAQIGATNAALEQHLRAFCQSLFANVVHLKAVTRRTAAIDAHYDAFVNENDEGTCPYCGYGAIKGVDYSRREAYDHFLPKGTYPFNSVNFKNLAPMCHECNSSYKLRKDPVRHIDPLHKSTANTRRKAFYSYAIVASGITVDMALAVTDFARIGRADINLTITAEGREEELESWKDVFGIEERYRAKCCEKNVGKAWLSRIHEENENYGLTPQQMLEAELRAAANKPWSHANFLKRPFLLACQNAGFFSAPTT